MTATSAENLRLSSSLKELESLTERRTEESHSLKEQIQRIAESKADLQEESQRRITELGRECEREVSDKKILQVKLESMEERLLDCKAQLAACQSQLEATKADSERREREKGEAVSAATTEGSRLAISLRDQEAISIRRLEEIQTLQDQLRQAADAKAAIHEDNQRRIAELVRECEREVGDRKALQTKLDGVDERLVDVKLQLAVCQSQLEASRAESERREKEKGEALAAANAEVTRITGLLREQDSVLSRRQEEIQSLKEQLRQAADAKSALQDEGQRRVAELVRECEREVNERKLLQAKLVTVDERMVDVKTQLAVCQSQLEASRADTDRREKEKSETLMTASAETGRVAALLKEQEALSERHAEEIQLLREQLRSGAESRSAVHEESQRRIAELSRECDREAGEKVALQLRLDGAEERLLDCKTQLAVCQSQLESARADVDRKESEKNEIRVELSKLAAERDLQVTKHVDMQQRLDDKEEQVREAMRTVAQAQEMQIGRVKELADERDALLEKLARSKEEAKHLKYERDKLKGQHSESEAQRQEMQTQLQQARAALEDAQSEIGQTQERLEESQRAKYEVLERHAVLEAEYRTYKTMCNTPTKLAEQLKKLVSLEGERASANSRISAAEVRALSPASRAPCAQRPGLKVMGCGQEDAESNRALVSNLREQVTALKQKLLVAENARRKLHNELQARGPNPDLLAPVPEHSPSPSPHFLPSLPILWPSQSRAFEAQRCG